MAHGIKLRLNSFTMIRGIDFNEMWAAVACPELIHMTATFIAAYGLIPWQIDFTLAYLNSKIEKEVYMQQPQGHEVVGKEDWVCHLLKTLYGTRQGASNWWKQLNQGFEGIGYYMSKADPCVRTRWEDEKNFSLTNTYTNDIFGASSTPQLAKTAKAKIKKCYEIKDLEEIQKLLGLKVTYNRELGEIFFSQQQYILSFLTEFSLQGVTGRTSPEPVGRVNVPNHKGRSQ